MDELPVELVHPLVVVLPIHQNQHYIGARLVWTYPILPLMEVGCSVFVPRLEI